MSVVIVSARSPFCDPPWQGKANDSYTSAPTQCVANKVFIAQAGAPVVAALTRRDDNSGVARQHAVQCRQQGVHCTGWRTSGGGVDKA